MSEKPSKLQKISFMLCISHYEPVPCKNGETRWRLKNPDNFLKEFVDARIFGLRGSVSVEGTPEGKIEYGNKPQSKRINLDDLNQQIQLYLKALYETFAMDPCNDANYQRFQDAQSYVLQAGFKVRLLDDVLNTKRNLLSRYDEMKKIKNQGNLQGHTFDQAKKATEFSIEDYQTSIQNEKNELLDEIVGLLHKIKTV